MGDTGIARGLAGPSPARADLDLSELSRGTNTGRVDSLYLPLLLAAGFLLLFLATLTGFHSFDGISYIRDIGKPLPALVLPHHLVYEPLVLAFYSLWQALGWHGDAERPAAVLSTLAGAGGVAVFYKIAWERCQDRATALLSTLLLAFTFGYWFYSVEVDIYLPPLFFLLLALWFVGRAAQRSSTALLVAAGLAHAGAVLFHQVALVAAAAFALGLFMMGGSVALRLKRVVVYGAAFAVVVVPAYLYAGVVVAGLTTVDGYLDWFNSYGKLGTWGVFQPDTLERAISGASAAISTNFITGRVLLAALLLLGVMRASTAIRKAGGIAWLLIAWGLIYAVFFTWWHPEVLKFWVLWLPAPLLLGVSSLRAGMPSRLRTAVLGASVIALAALVLTNAPEVVARRDPMSDPQRRVSADLASRSGAEDLILLQAGSAEVYLPYYYGRKNIMSTRELWYLEGGEAGRVNALGRIERAVWHALAKGSDVWIEDRVLTPGVRTSDHYVFSSGEVDALLSPYGPHVEPEVVVAWPERFLRLSAETVFSTANEWHFTADQQGWTGINIAGETVSEQGWCFAPGADPNLYSPPIRIEAGAVPALEVTISSPEAGQAQFFFRKDVRMPYAEEQSLTFDIAGGDGTYRLDTADLPAWEGTVVGLRLDPPESGNLTPGADNTICIRRIDIIR